MLNRTHLTRPLFALAALALGSAPAAAASFTPLGDLADDDFYSFAYGLSGDGTTAVGESHSGNGLEAFRWAGSMSGLGDLPLGIFESSARGVSGNGSVVVGVGDGASGTTAFVWNTTTTTLTPLSPLLAGGTSAAYAISGNGLHTVGSSDTAPGVVQAVSWLGTAAPVGLGDLAGGAFRSQALAVSDDGLAIVGDSDSDNGAEAFLWTGVMTGLGDLTGGAFDSQALGVSPDGTLVVGRGESASGDEAFLYQSGLPMVGLGDLAGGIFESVAYDVTDAGVVVGSSASTAGPEAFIWVGGTMYSLLDVLVANGLAAEVSGWTLSEARAISDDGFTIAGWGVDPDGATQGWITTIATIPEPSTGLLLTFGLALLVRRRRA